ncbi:hypothetical protein HanHA300_Chr07g0249131 [Helianthus annuus]|nr:hypothetical protein HanHA300_Chr07g0249131 [Helianthus annuus]KAJ0563688.1 hypothetical protein HanHA89_Chr07g0265941 [Helianthus annuus]KAJ0729021.1 hypothetical protein HanLR1_Chr07g0248251 [Helianthus annuus]KAJ0731773.1 hypothetical protein HanOQP8_Chr07g0255771 [Helianthus annuus]
MQTLQQKASEWSGVKQLQPFINLSTDFYTRYLFLVSGFKLIVIILIKLRSLVLGQWQNGLNLVVNRGIIGLTFDGQT